MKLLVNFFQKRRMQYLMNKANEALYSQHLAFNDFLVSILNEKILYDPLQVVIAINTITELTEPLSKFDVFNSLEILKNITQATSTNGYESTLAKEERRARSNWTSKLEYIHRGKQASQNNKYSYEGAIYTCEKAKRGVSSTAERNKWKQLCSEIIQAEQNYDNYLTEKAKQQEVEDEATSYAKAEAVLKKIASEVEKEKWLYSEKSKEQLKLEREEILSDLRASLANLKKE